MKKIITSQNAPKPIGPYSQAVQIGDLLYVSGQIPVDAKIGKVVEGGVAEQTKMVMENIGHILKEANLDFSNIIKSSIFTTDLSQFPVINEIYGSFLNEPFPARETVEVSKLPLGVLVEISVIASK